ncbi:DUF892 family protein [Rhizomonospora bruguierae]|uniref:DUF892 family protein n=1 Tax=Rhizomonospora bruguierae TaxID=1581705 RepID=UPI001BCD1528|nr:DUF892 family protein [Micromonospora sp. NBRC 107566]
MPIDTFDELVKYEMGLVRDIESSGLRLLDFAFHRVNRDDLAQMIGALKEEGERHRDQIAACMEAAGAVPTASVSEAAEGVYERFQSFVALKPSADMVSQFAADTVVRFLRLSIVAHSTLLDRVVLLGDTGCVRTVQSNLLQKLVSVARFEQVSHELGAQFVAQAAGRA